VKPAPAEPTGKGTRVRLPRLDRSDSALAALPEKKFGSTRLMQALGLLAMEDESGAIGRPVGKRANLAHRRRSGSRQWIVGNKIDRHEASFGFV
jgi:hypothetical protein